MRTFIVGCGYLGSRARQHWVSAGHSVQSLTRSPDRADQWRTVGTYGVVGDVLDPECLLHLPACDVLLYAVGYDRTAGVDKRTVYVDGLRNVLSAMRGKVGRFLYISSSSVYGQDAGEWVDESSPTEPQTDGGAICLEAEGLLRDSEWGQTGRSVILRLTGIYGPGRLLTRVESLRAGTPLAGSSDAWLNLIHVDDAAAAVVAVANAPAPGNLYLVSDDRPVRRGVYYGELSRLVGAPPPVFDPSEPPRHGQGLNKRCRNQFIRESLRLEWRYPSFVEGLTSCLGTQRP